MFYNLQRRHSSAAGLSTDVIEFNVNGHKLYLSACMDLYNGEIVAYRVARRPVFEIVSGTLEAAPSRTRCAAELIVHSDQGWHYKMQPYRAMLARCGVKQSMSRKGNCLDTLEAGVHDYVHYYNHERIKRRSNAGAIQTDTTRTYLFPAPPQ